jgi:hypothetical protein
VTVDAPFAPDAYRVENGVITAGPGCSRPGCENIKTQKIMEHPFITTRVIAVDEDLGITLLRMNFGQTNSYGPGTRSSSGKSSRCMAARSMPWKRS